MTNAAILIVEDDQPVAEAVAERLERCGYTVCATVSSGQQAVETAAEMRPDLALLVDLGLAGGMDGPEVAEQMRRRFDVPVVYLTDDAAGDLLQRAEGTQPFGYLLKPVEARQARLTIATALHRHRKERELQQTIDELQRQAQLFHTIFDSIADGVVVVENDKVPSADALLFNPRAKEIIGIGPTDTGPDQWAEEYGLFHVDQVTPIPAEQQALVRAMNGTSTDEKEVFLRNRARPDGLYIRGSARPLLSDTGVCRGGVIVFRDLTAQREAERELQETVDKLQRQTQIMQAVFDSMSDGVIAVDANGARLLFNPGAERILGVNIRTNRKIDQWAERYGIFYPDEVTPVPADQLPLVRAMRHGEVINEREVVVRNAAKPEGVYVSVNSRPILNDAGELLGGVSVYRDVTAHKDMKSRLQETVDQLERQTQLFQTIFDNMNDGVVAVDENGDELLYNPSAKRIIGFRATHDGTAEWTAKHGFFFPDRVTLIPTHDLALAHAMRGESVDDREMFVRNQNNPEGRYLNVSGRPLLDDTGESRGGLIVFRDITEQKEAESKLKETIAALSHQTQLMQAVFDSMSEGVIVADADGNQVLFNSSAERITGIGPTDKSARQWTEEYGIFLADGVTPIPMDQRAILRALAGEATDETEMFIRNRERSVGVSVSVNGKPLLDDTGRPGGGVVVFRDITQ